MNSFIVCGLKEVSKRPFLHDGPTKRCNVPVTTLPEGLSRMEGNSRVQTRRKFPSGDI
jgi:hypothetical protein